MIVEQNHKETMQGNLGAPIGCLQSGVLPNIQDGVPVLGGFSEHMDKISYCQGVVEPGNSFIMEGLGTPAEGHYRPFIQPNFVLWSGVQTDMQAIPQSHFNYIDNQFYPMNQEYPIFFENGVKQMPFPIVSQGYPNQFQFQEFQYFVVIDFEATCDKEKNLHPQEIIEFPSVLVNSTTGQLEASFQTYVRPVHHQLLTDFCKELTGIQQIQVDRGVPLSEALLMHDKWLEEKGIKHTNFAVVTWGDWDCRVMLESECKFKKLRKPPYFNRWINLKVPFQKVFGGLRCNLKEAVQLAGLAWEGRAHCGLDDSRNTARLLAHLMHLGFRFSITNSLNSRSNDQSSTFLQSSYLPSGTSHYSHHKFRQPLPMTQSHDHMDQANKEQCMYCYCGAKSSKRMIRKPGPKQGSFFFGCGNWTTTRGALCSYFEWASP